MFPEVSQLNFTEDYKRYVIEYHEKSIKDL